MAEVDREYAVALFELACETHAEKAYLDGIREILAVLKESPDYTEILCSPNIPSDERDGMLTQAFGHVPEHVLSVTQLLCRKGHLNRYEDFVNEYEKLYLSLCAVSRAKVVSAVPLTDGEKTALLAKLTALSKHKVEAEYETDASILGGVIVTMDDRIIDGSLRHKLYDVKEVLGK